jgi:hypothetical protein
MQPAPRQEPRDEARVRRGNHAVTLAMEDEGGVSDPSQSPDARIAQLGLELATEANRIPLG